MTLEELLNNFNASDIADALFLTKLGASGTKAARISRLVDEGGSATEILNLFRAPDLQWLAGLVGISTVGRKAQLIARLEGVRTDFIQTLSVKDQKKLAPVDVWEHEYDEDETTETGNVLIRFKLKQKITPKDGDPFTQRVVLVDASTGEAIEQPIYGGTMARLKGQIVPYTNAASKSVGVTLRLRSCQVHELVTGDGSGGAFWSDFGDS